MPDLVHGHGISAVQGDADDGGTAGAHIGSGVACTLHGGDQAVARVPDGRARRPGRLEDRAVQGHVPGVVVRIVGRIVPRGRHRQLDVLEPVGVHGAADHGVGLQGGRGDAHAVDLHAVGVGQGENGAARRGRDRTSRVVHGIRQTLRHIRQIHDGIAVAAPVGRLELVGLLAPHPRRHGQGPGLVLAHLGSGQLDVGLAVMAHRGAGLVHRKRSVHGRRLDVVGHVERTARFLDLQHRAGGGDGKAAPDLIRKVGGQVLQIENGIAVVFGDADGGRVVRAVQGEGPDLVHGCGTTQVQPGRAQRPGGD